jgi:DNA-binding CsgD family transcriptional regulator
MAKKIFNSFHDLVNLIDQMECVGLMAGAKDKEHRFIHINSMYSNFHMIPSIDIIGKKSSDMPNGISILKDIMKEQDDQVIYHTKSVVMASIHPDKSGDPRAYKFKKFPATVNGIGDIILFTGEDCTCDTNFWGDILWRVRPQVDVEKMISFSYRSMLEKNHSHGNLKDNELSILSLLLRGVHVKRISSILDISTKSLEHRINTLKEKFNATSMENLLDTAKEHGFQSMISRAIFNTHMTYNVSVEQQ